MASKNDGKAVATKAAGAVIPHDYGTDAGAGFENQTMADLVLPFLGLIQALSPKVTNKVGDGGLEGAKTGMLHNSVTDELFEGDAGVEFIPASTKHLFVEWVPRKQGGGFVGIHQPEDEAVQKAVAGSSKFGKYSTAYAEDGKPTGNDMVETFYVYGVLVTSEGVQPCVMTFKSTAISVYKRWNTKVQMFCKDKIPLFANRVRVSSVSQTNSEGTFCNYVLAPFEGDMASSLLPPDDERFTSAKEVKKMMDEGTATINHAGAAEEAPGTGTESDDPPF